MIKVELEQDSVAKNGTCSKKKKQVRLGYAKRGSRKKGRKEKGED
jgi:hypothetical protein